MIPNCKKDLDFYYPIGTYYETSDVSFNPNEVWGGEWLQDSKGLSTIGAYEEDDEDPNNNARFFIKQGTIARNSIITWTSIRIDKVRGIKKIYKLN